MTHQERCRLHELKGTLACRRMCIEHDLNMLSHLAGEVESSHYKGYVMGQMDMLKRVLRDISDHLDLVCQIIEEGESDDEEENLPF